MFNCHCVRLSTNSVCFSFKITARAQLGSGGEKVKKHYFICKGCRSISDFRNLVEMQCDRLKTFSVKLISNSKLKVSIESERSLRIQRNFDQAYQTEFQ